jgi:hypothetical protein
LSRYANKRCTENVFIAHAPRCQESSRGVNILRTHCLPGESVCGAKAIFA